jgi:hypothetical protein
MMHSLQFTAMRSGRRCQNLSIIIKYRFESHVLVLLYELEAALPLPVFYGCKNGLVETLVVCCCYCIFCGHARGTLNVAHQKSTW